MSSKEKAKTFMFVCLVIIFAAGQGEAEDIDVVNPSFEDYVIGAGSFTWHGEGLIDNGWQVETGAAVGVFRPTIIAYSSVPDSVNTAYSQEYTISQVLTSILEAGTGYTLTVEIGNPANIGGFPGYRIELWAGAALLAADDNTLTPDEGTWETSTVEYSSPLGDPQAGELLEVRLISLGPEVGYDLVQLQDDVEVAGDVSTWGAVKAMFR